MPSSLRDAVSARLAPSITTWTRIEPKPRDGTMARSLQAQVRGPVWMLARQLQFGEFMGEDAGSLVQAALGVANRTLTTYRPGNDPAATVALETTLPLEVHVEREPAVLKLRAAVQLGLWFERRVRGAGASNATILTLRSTYPIPPPNDDDGDEGAAFRTLVTSHVVDGVALFGAATGAAGVPPLPGIATSDPAVVGAIAALVAYRQSLYSEPKNDRAWQPQGLTYDFASTALVGLAQPKGPTVTVKGEAVDLWCYMEGGDRGPAKKDCATTCAKAGNPIGIVDAKGNVYVTAGLEDHQPARDLLIEKMSEQVTATGTLVTKGGTKMLFIKSVK